MNKRAKKENLKPKKVLTDKTNISKAKNTKKNEDVTPKVVNVLRESNRTNSRKPRNTQKTKSVALPPKATVERKDEVKSPYCFGFSDSDMDNEGTEYCGELTKFDNSKPYRLALYVRPSKSIRISPALIQKLQNLNPTLNLTNMSMNTTSALKKKCPVSDSFMVSPNRTQWKVPFSSTPKDTKKNQSKMVQKKITDILQPSPKRTRSANAEQQFTSYFEDSRTTEEELSSPSPKVLKKSRKDMKENTVTEASSSDDTQEPACFRKPSRRSYIKKSRPEPEIVDEPPTEEILKSVEKSKKEKKGRGKKNEQEEEEFEKWSKSMNSMFSEVDQFEISFG